MGSARISQNRQGHTQQLVLMLVGQSLWFRLVHIYDQGQRCRTYSRAVQQPHAARLDQAMNCLGGIRDHTVAIPCQNRAIISDQRRTKRD